MNLIPAKMLKAYRTGDLEITASWADLEASQIIDAKLLGAKFANIETDLSQEVVDRTADVDAEEARATKAEADLQATIDTNDKRAIEAEEALSTNLSQEVVDRTADVDDIQDQIDILDQQFIGFTDVVEVNTLFVNGTAVGDLSEFQGTSSFSLTIDDAITPNSLGVFINGIEVNNAESQHTAGAITVPFEIDGDDILVVKYIKAPIAS